ncbi:RNA polymerase sigma factor [Flavivirga sp. 57AJ16]|uniref:RNA polymerase sigma factor n=1 Tax=Flavivirga sp. 57AJ16 TaxID=3025307 RepID=UPI0023673916|nr:RNA polymerase sigma-70 factor [Flavivirga sp. 57AJ16]MDD7884556.1 RNA polymerase sigma-70 factor [Flavivirga sp. 57AJ16]
MKHNKQHTSLLITALKKGDERAFKTIYESNKKPLSAFINSYTKNQAQTDDIVQDTFIKLWNAKEGIDENISLGGFLCKIAYYTFIDTFRKKKREQSMLDVWQYKKLMLLVKEESDIKKEKIHLIEKAIEKLPPKCKEIFVMSKFEQLKYAEIAEQLGLSIKTVEVQMGKAFSIIRKEVNKSGLFNLFLHFSGLFFLKKKGLGHPS